MGALASHDQRDEVRDRVNELSHQAEIVYGGKDEFDLIDADAGKGSFFMPTLLFCHGLWLIGFHASIL